MEMEGLPEELLRTIISLTSPRDACRAAAVSRAFRAAADSDIVWSCFLPRDLPRFTRKPRTELPREPLSKKGLFRRLATQPTLLRGKVVSMRLDIVAGAKCYTLSARTLCISSWDTLRSSRWIRHEVHGGKRFSMAARITAVRMLDISGKIQSKMLSMNTAYTAYMVFKLEDWPSNLDFPFQEALVIGAGGSRSTRQICLQACANEDEDVAAGAPRYRIVQSPFRTRPSTVTPGEDVLLPRRRADGWSEVELGRFYNEEDDDREVSVSLTETTSNNEKNGLIVRAIELRASTTCE